MDKGLMRATPCGGATTAASRRRTTERPVRDAIPVTCQQHVRDLPDLISTHRLRRADLVSSDGSKLHHEAVAWLRWAFAPVEAEPLRG